MELVRKGAKALHIEVTAEHLRAFQIYHQELLEWNQKFNLTAITEYENAQIRHFLDSLTCLLALEREKPLRGDALIDVGTGAGFPGLVLKILRPELCLTLLEATAKKTRFLHHIVRRLGLQGVTIIHARAESLGHDPRHRERYDWAVARAVAEMPVLAEYLLPFVKVKGRVLAQKGEDAAAEVQRAEYAITRLGGRVRKLLPLEIHGLAETRYLVVIDKVAATPATYPRRPGMPSKRPLLAES
ncbi:MAG: 16S rRNA (guanine(527)-N(7))-methyltransferase RsmG [Anaerolineae bacterium]